jgi:hypothetical protein
MEKKQKAFLAFEEAMELARALNLNTAKDFKESIVWQKFIKSKK